MTAHAVRRAPLGRGGHAVVIVVSAILAGACSRQVDRGGTTVGDASDGDGVVVDASGPPGDAGPDVGGANCDATGDWMLLLGIRPDHPYLRAGDGGGVHLEVRAAGAAVHAALRQVVVREPFRCDDCPGPESSIRRRSCDLVARTRSCFVEDFQEGVTALDFEFSAGMSSATGRWFQWGDSWGGESCRDPSRPEGLHEVGELRAYRIAEGPGTPGCRPEGHWFVEFYYPGENPASAGPPRVLTISRAADGVFVGHHLEDGPVDDTCRCDDWAPTWDAAPCTLQLVVAEARCLGFCEPPTPRCETDYDRVTMRFDGDVAEGETVHFSDGNIHGIGTPVDEACANPRTNNVVAGLRAFRILSDEPPAYPPGGLRD